MKHTTYDRVRGLIAQKEILISSHPKSVNRKSAVAVMLVFMGFVQNLSRTRRFGDDFTRSPWIR